jgi:hypothetical protein
LSKRLERLDFDPVSTVFEPPSPNVQADLARVEETVGVLPLSLRAWYEEVGHVSLMGDVPGICSYENDYRVGDEIIHIMSDPLVVDPLIQSLVEYEEYAEAEEDSRFLFPLAPDRYHKHNISGGGDEGIYVPELRADGIYTGSDGPFVEYLRQSYYWGIRRMVRSQGLGSR